MRYPTAKTTLTLSAIVLTLSLLNSQAAGAQTSATRTLKQAASSLSKARSFEFTLSAKSVTPGFALSAITSGTGKILFPDQFVFTGALQQTPALTAPFVVAGCGPAQYVEMGDGQFNKMEGAPNIARMLFLSDTSFMTRVLTQLANASAPKTATLNKMAVSHIAGTVPEAVLATLPFRPSKSEGAVKAELWIDQKNHRLNQIALIGVLFTGDTPQTVRTFTLSRFDEKIPLTVPRGQMPCTPKPAPKG